jgi:hypothetical protein
MAISNRYSSLARQDLIITEYPFLIQSLEKGIRKLHQEFDRDPTVVSKVMAISNCYSILARPDLIITEYRFLIHSMQKCIRKTLVRV